MCGEAEGHVVWGEQTMDAAEENAPPPPPALVSGEGAEGHVGEGHEGLGASLLALREGFPVAADIVAPYSRPTSSLGGPGTELRRTGVPDAGRGGRAGTSAPLRPQVHSRCPVSLNFRPPFVALSACALQICSSRCVLRGDFAQREVTFDALAY